MSRSLLTFNFLLAPFQLLRKQSIHDKLRLRVCGLVSIEWYASMYCVVKVGGGGVWERTDYYTTARSVLNKLKSHRRDLPYYR
jgi:hypothetical protein